MTGNRRDPGESDIDLRAGLPAGLRLLADRHPRETWRPETLGGTARFWLARHDMFRELGGELDGMIGSMRAGDGTSGAMESSGRLVQTLGFFLNQLNEHHHVEDHHYFPIFRDADPRLAAGFEILDRDHETIHADLVATADAANALIRIAATGATAEAGRREADVFGDATETLLRRVLRHLEDEEDLIIPLILDRGERAFGIG